MKLSSLAFFTVFLLSPILSFGHTSTAEGNGSISGRITIGGKGAAGISVVARASNSPLENRLISRTSTDEDGNYRLTGLKAGRLTVTAIAKAYVLLAIDRYDEPSQTMVLAEDESIKNVDFALVRGGVITGRITDHEGRPIIGERISVVVKTETGAESFSVTEIRGRAFMFPGGKYQTDDRGVYRIYGLAPGKYTVSVGDTVGGITWVAGMPGSRYAKTYYPGVTDESKAAAIEIREGAEVTSIDITPAKQAPGFSASGRVIDTESGQPVAGVFVGYSSIESRDLPGGMNATGSRADANGSFRLEGLKPGRYAALTTFATPEVTSYSDPVPFEIAEGDVTGIEIRLRRGGTIEGVAVVENNSDPSVAALLRSVSLFALVTQRKGTTAPSFSRGVINSDGSFHLAGLPPGKVRIRLIGFPTPPKGLQLLRIELNGMDQPEGIDVTAGAQVKGVRLVFAYGTGTIRGEVKFEGGVMLPAMVSIKATGSSNPIFAEVDSRGRFVAENLSPGAYELTVRPPGNLSLFTPVTRSVAVANGTESPVTIVIDLSKKVEPN